MVCFSISEQESPRASGSVSARTLPLRPVLQNWKISVALTALMAKMKVQLVLEPGFGRSAPLYQLVCA
jgi:hypothetical protein